MPSRFTTPRKYDNKYPFQTLANNHLPPHILIHNINNGVRQGTVHHNGG